MTVHTRATGELVVGTPGKATIVVISRTRVTTPVMTVLTEIRHPLCQQLAVPAAVRIVTGSAVLFDRRMLPNKGSALLCVAGVAKLVAAVGAQHALFHRAMWVVAISTGNLAFDDRVMRGFVDIAADIFVAVETDVRLADFWSSSSMDTVAIGTSGFTVVLADIPEGQFC